MAAVGSQSTTALLKTIDKKLTTGAKHVHLMLSSPGGSVFHGLSIYNFLRGAPIKVNVAVFDRLKRRDNKVASFDRLVVLSFVNFLELCICFGLLYASDWHRLSGAGRSVTAFYFSAITQTTIGYGDVYPTGYLRIIAACQGIISLVFAALVFTRFVGTLPRINAILDDGETALAQSEAPRGTR